MCSRFLVIGALLVCATFSLAADAKAPAVTYAVLPESLVARWNTEDCNVIWIGDSISSATYLRVQGSIFNGIAEVHPNIVGFQQTYDGQVQDAIDAHEMKMDNTYNAANGQTLGQPGKLTNRSAGGVNGFLPVQGKTFQFFSNMANNALLYNTGFTNSLQIENTNWWMGKDVRVDWIYYREAASNPSALRLVSFPNDEEISNIDYDLLETAVLAESTGETLGVFESVPSGDGLCVISQLSNNGTVDPFGTTARVRFRLTDNFEDEDGKEVRFAMPFFQDASAVGFRAWGAGFSGWRTFDHARTSGVAGENFYTNDAISQFTACVNATGHPLNTIVIALGANDGEDVSVTTLRANLAATIDRWAVEMSQFTSDPIQVLIVGPYVFSFLPNGHNTPDNVISAATMLQSSGTQHVDGADIGVIDLKEAMGGLWFWQYNPAWPASTGNVHPSPVGANGIAQLIQDAFDMPPKPADLNADGCVDATDLALLLASWGECAGCSADFDMDRFVGSADMAILLAAWE